MCQQGNETAAHCEWVPQTGSMGVQEEVLSAREKWFEHVPEAVLNENCQLPRDYIVQSGNKIRGMRSDLWL